MARDRHKLFERIAELPWPAGLALAVLSYLLMTQVAPGLLDQSSASTAFGQALVSLAPLVAGLFVLAALLSFGCWLARHRLFSRRRGIHAIRWCEFERCIAAAYRRQGFLVQQTAAGTDSDIDLVLRRALEKYYVRCKHWQSRRVGVSAVRELHACVRAGQADGGFVVTTGHFSRAAKSFAATTCIQLVDGEQLAQLIGAVRAAADQPQ